MPPNRHWSWDFYESFAENPKLAKCQGCGQQYSNGSVSRMTKHLKNCDKFNAEIKTEILSKIEAKPLSTKLSKSSNPYKRGNSTVSNEEDSDDLCKTLEEVIKAATSMPSEAGGDNEIDLRGFPSFNNVQNFVNMDESNQLLVKVNNFGFTTMK
uniref:BED-type domain-containing protein n=1 Tax=Panagrolaimus sp. PS1159 TaxID=55785 RepID=A0AC35GY17_9BILA